MKIYSVECTDKYTAAVYSYDLDDEQSREFEFSVIGEANILAVKRHCKSVTDEMEELYDEVSELRKQQAESFVDKEQVDALRKVVDAGLAIINLCHYDEQGTLVTNKDVSMDKLYQALEPFKPVRTREDKLRALLKEAKRLTVRARLEAVGRNSEPLIALAEMALACEEKIKEVEKHDREAV